MELKLTEEFQTTFAGKTYDSKEIERELFSIALRHKLPSTLVILKFFDWAGITPGKANREK